MFDVNIHVVFTQEFHVYIFMLFTQKANTSGRWLNVVDTRNISLKSICMVYMATKNVRKRFLPSLISVSQVKSDQCISGQIRSVYLRSDQYIFSKVRLVYLWHILTH